MKNKIILNLFSPSLIIFALLVCISAQTNDYKKLHLTADGKYVILQSVRLKKAVDGLNGKIEILQDARLTDDINIMQSKGYPPDLYSDDAKIKEMFEKVPFRPAILRIIDGNKVIDSKTLDCIQAGITTVKLYNLSKPSYQINCHYTTVAPNEGEEMTFVEVVKGNIQWLEAIDKKTKEKVEMAFVSSARVDWKFSRADGKSKDILRVYTGWDDNDSGGDFCVYYQRFHFDGKHWIRYERKVKYGYWEVESPFPKISNFPKVK